MDVSLQEGLQLAGKLTIKTFKHGRLVRQLGPMPNKVVSSNGYGRNLIIRALAGDNTYPIEIDSASLGDDDTAPADGDTGLGNSLVSGLTITNSTIANNKLTLELFAPDGDLPDATYKEFGLFADDRIMTRLLVNPNYTKAPGEDTLFTYELTATG